MYSDSSEWACVVEVSRSRRTRNQTTLIQQIPDRRSEFQSSQNLLQASPKHATRLATVTWVSITMYPQLSQIDHYWVLFWKVWGITRIQKWRSWRRDVDWCCWWWQQRVRRRVTKPWTKPAMSHRINQNLDLGQDVSWKYIISWPNKNVQKVDIFIWHETTIEVASISGSFKLHIFIEFQGAMRGNLKVYLSVTLSNQIST
jgi:hypothetical protein